MPHLPQRARAVLALTALAAPASALQGGLDLQVVALPVNQSIQTGSTTLVAGKTTVIRCAIETAGEIPAGAQVDGLLRAFIGGVEADWSPVYSLNGPIDVPELSSPADLDSTLNFAFVAPEGSGVEFVAEVNPSGPNQIAESDTSNNELAIGPLTFECVGVADVVWVPVDYRPSGGSTPNLPDPALIEPGVGDNFFTGAFPGPDVEYRQTAAGTKLWTSSLSGTGSQLNNSLLMDLQMMNPQPNFIYGWIPGSLPYNGQAIGIPGQAAMGNTDPVRHQRTMAHEVGHLIGLFHTGDKINNFGLDVEHALNVPLGLSELKNPGQNDIMVAGQVTSSAWIDQGSYDQAINHPAWACGGAFDLAVEAPDGAWNARRLMVTGLIDRDAGSGQLTHVLAFDGGRATPAGDAGEANVVLRAWVGGELAHELPLVVRSSADHCEECRVARSTDSDLEPLDAGFVAVLPATIDPDRVERLELVAVGGEVLAEHLRSGAAPALELVGPRPSAPLGPVVPLEWEASDADGDSLTFVVRYSPDGEQVLPIASGLTESRLDVRLAELPTPVPGRAWLEVLASDGLRTTRVVTQGLGQGGMTGYAAGSTAPRTHVLTPDAGKSFPFGATVLLHASGHDLEDGPLTGASLQWTSDLDGPIAVGRVASAASLSVGVHTLTVTATDATGVAASDSTQITITERGLPDGGVVCQVDLGFGGPGSSALSACGGDLSSGTTVDLRLVGAAANEAVFVGISLVQNPTAIFGGTVVTNPTIALVIDQTDVDGEWALPGLPGGGGPATFFAQAVHLDAAQAGGFGISNAVQLEFLP